MRFIVIFLCLISSPNFAFAQRTYLTGNTTFLVSSSGEDSVPCGNASSPCLTKQGAWNAALLVDAMNFTVTISDPACSDEAPLAATSPIIGAQQPIYVTGNVSSPCAVTNTTGGDAFRFDGPIKISLSGFNPSSSGGLGGSGVHASRGAEVDYGAGIILGAAGSGRSFADAARIVYTAPYTIGPGSSAEVDHVINGGVIAADSQNVTCQSGAEITSYWLGNGGGWASYTGPVTFTNCTNVNTQYFVHLNGATKLAGTVLPGATGSSINGNVDDVITGLQVGVNGSIWMGSGQTADSATQLQFNGTNFYITPPGSGKAYIKGGIDY
jgi:hypothetical protein